MSGPWLPEPREIPLFLLDSVLLPHAEMPLSVFEPRYLRLIEDAMANEGLFGVVSIADGEEVGDLNAVPHTVGTLARIVAVGHDDEVMKVLIQGEGRFRLLDTHRIHPYLTGIIEAYPEHPPEDVEEAERVHHQLAEEFTLLVHSIFAARQMRVEMRIPRDPYILSFALAQLLPFSQDARQRMLEMTDTTERLREIRPLLREVSIPTPSMHLEPLGREDLSEYRNPN